MLLVELCLSVTLTVFCMNRWCAVIVKVLISYTLHLLSNIIVYLLFSSFFSVVNLGCVVSWQTL